MNNKYGKFRVTDKGLVEVKDEPIKVKIKNRWVKVEPNNLMYNVVSYYGR